MCKKEEYLFQQSNSYWICKKLNDNDEEKVRDHCHVKYLKCLKYYGFDPCHYSSSPGLSWDAMLKMTNI